MRLGPYQVSQLLGKGGMGEVYLAQDTRLDRKVAIKVLPPDSTRNEEHVRRFEQEAKAASALNHPNILTIYDFGAVGDHCYIAMEYVEGRTLRNLLGGGRLPATQALECAAQCADGLAAAHAAGIIHRDIKPPNIMVRPDGYVKILDFGLAKLDGPPSITQDDKTALTVTGQIMGTAQYMSPEQSRGQELDARTDVWSLGAVLYEMVSGKSPFAGPTMSDTMASVLTRDPEPLSAIGIPPGEPLDRILQKALAKDPRQRYQSMADMAVDLRRLRRELEAPSLPNRKPLRKLPFFVASGLVLAALLMWTIVSHRTPRATPAQLPERRLSYSLLVQKMRNGKPYQAPFYSTGREIFENGWKVKFDFMPAQSGSLYLLNEEPRAEGEVQLSLVFPTPSVNDGVAAVTANTDVDSTWLVLDNHSGREEFWIVWAVHPVADLEQAREAMFAAFHAGRPDPQVIRDPQLVVSIPTWLARAPLAGATEDAANHRINLVVKGDVIASRLELEHR
jgi:serine/threonine protein kinase